MKLKKTALLFGVLAVLLTGCGKKTPAEEPAVTSSPTATSQPSPTPTEAPATPTGTPLEKLLGATQFAFSGGNYSVDITVTRKLPENAETESRSLNSRFVRLDDAELVFHEKVYEDGSRTHEYIFLQPEGGVHMSTWWGDSKMNYEYVSVSKEDAEVMYSFAHGLHESPDEVFRVFAGACRQLFSDWPKELPEDVSLSKLLASFGTEEYLKKNFGYRAEEDGSDAYVISGETLAKAIQSSQEKLQGLKYIVDARALMSFSSCRDIAVKVRYDGAALQGIDADFEFDDGSEAQIRLVIHDIGSTVISIPKAAEEKFETMKHRVGGEDEISSWFLGMKRYLQDAKDGKIDRDAATLDTLLMTIYTFIQDPEINAEVKKAIEETKEGEIVIYYSEGSEYDKTGIPSVDAKLREKYGDSKLQMESVAYVPLNFQVIFAVNEESGLADLYYLLNP